MSRIEKEVDNIEKQLREVEISVSAMKQKDESVTKVLDIHKEQLEELALRIRKNEMSLTKIMAYGSVGGAVMGIVVQVISSLL